MKNYNILKLKIAPWIKYWIEKKYSLLPKEYEELEYLESTGTQYIDLERVPNMTDIIEQKFQRKDTSTTTQSWYGSMPSSSINKPRISIGSYSQGFFVAMNNTGKFLDILDTNIHTIKFWCPTVYTQIIINNGVQTKLNLNDSAYSPAVTLSSYLFARHGTSGVQLGDGQGTRIFYHKEYLQNGTLVLNCIPCRRKSDNVLGMYDKVSKKFLTNAGNGEFIAGGNI